MKMMRRLAEAQCKRQRPLIRNDRSKWRVCLFASLARIACVGITIVTPVVAQQKSFTWMSDPQQLILNPPIRSADLFDEANATLYRSSALAFLRATIACKDSSTPPKLIPCVADTSPTFLGSKDYVIIHVVRWNDPDTKTGSQTIDKENWYVFNNGKTDWDDNDYATNNRIFGSRKVFLLYLHFNAKSSYRARYILTSKKKTPAYLLHFTSLLQVYGVQAAGGAPCPGVSFALPNAVWGVAQLDAYYVPSDLSFEPAMLPAEPSKCPDTASASRAEPPVPSAGNTGRASGPSTSGLPPTSNTVPTEVTPSAPTTGSRSGANPARETSTPSLPPTSNTVPGEGNPTASSAEGDAANSSLGANAQKSLAAEVKLNSHTFDDEGLYHFDFSVAVPIRKISEISYVESSNTLVPAKVDKQTTFGVIDYYFKPVDIKGSGWSLYPHALAGVAINSHPLKRILIGGGYGPLLAHFYMGLVLSTQSLPAGTSCGKVPTVQQLAAGGLHNRICPGISMGLNVSAGAVLESLKGKSGSK